MRQLRISFARALSSHRGRKFLGIFLSAFFLCRADAAVHVVSPTAPAGEAGSLERAFAESQNGDEITLQNGLYRINPASPAGLFGAPLKLLNKTNITVKALGTKAEILGPGPGEFIILFGCSTVRFQGITFRSDNAPVENQNWLYSMIMLYGANEKLAFENCKFLNFGNHAISQLFGIKESTDVIVRNCFFADGGDRTIGDGAAISGIGSRWLVESNRIERCLIGIEIEGQWGTNRNITVRKNTIISPRGAGIVVFATSGKSSDFSDIEISDNVIQDAVRDTAEAAFPLGILVGGGERIRILRNVVDRTDNCGIMIHAQWADVRDTIVAGNVISNALFTGIQVYEFLDHRATNILVRSNIVVASGQVGIKVSGASIRVSGNTIENSGYRGDFGGVQIEGTNTHRVRIDGNLIRNRDSTAQDYGIWILPEVRDSIIGPNEFRNNVLGAIHDQGTNTVIETRLLGASFPTWELGSTVKIFAPPRSSGQIQTSDNLTLWTSVYPFETDSNCEASVLVTADMIMQGKRYYRAVR
jgi:hypothetical protein